MLKRDKKQYGMIAFSFLLLYLQPVRRSYRFSETVKSAWNQESPHKEFWE